MKPGRICIISLLRVISITQWDLNDITYSCVDVMIYSVLEPTLGIVNVCLPTIRPAILTLLGEHPHSLKTPPTYTSGNSNSWNSTRKGSLPNRRKLPGRGPVDDIPNDGF